MNPPRRFFGMDLPDLRYFIPWLVPVALVVGAIRLLLNPWFPQFEYHMPYFPADSYGFTIQDRLTYSRQAMDYLVTNQDIAVLKALRFPPGQMAPPTSCVEMDDCTRLFNDAELNHLVDVKNVINVATVVWYAALVLLLVSGLLAWKGGWLRGYRIAVGLGGRLATGVLVFIGMMVLFFFDWFFTLFHQVFFTGESWRFWDSDTLIRLFPERFWMDTFIYVGVISGVIGLILALVLRERRPRA